MTYYIFFFILLGLVFLTQIDRKFVLFYIFAIVVFYGFSYEVGMDRPAYLGFFRNLSEHGLVYTRAKSEYAGFELGFTLYTYIITLFTKNYVFYIVCLCITNTLLYYKAFRRIFKKNAEILLLFFIILYGNRLLTSTLRQALAVGFFLNAIASYYYNNKNYLLWIFVGFLFHSSCILFFVIMFFDRLLKKSKKRYEIVLLICIIIGALGLDLAEIIIKLIASFSSNVFIHKLEIYYALNEATNFSLFDIAIWLFCLIVLLRTEKNDISVFYTLVLISQLINLGFPGMSILMNRTKYYLGFGYIFCNYRFCINEQKKSYFIYLFFLVVVLGLYTINYIPNGFDYSYFNPYKNYFIESINSIDLPY